MAIRRDPDGLVDYGFGGSIDTSLETTFGTSGGTYDTVGTSLPVVSVTPTTTTTQQPINTNTSYSTFLSATNYIINILSNINDAVIYVDGVNTFKTTPNKIEISTNDLPVNYARGKEVTVQKEGYDSFEKYIFYIERNANFPNVVYDSNINFQPIYSSEKFFKIKIEYYKNDTLQSFPYIQDEQIQTIEFNLSTKKIKPVEDTPVVVTTPNTFLVNLDGPDNSVDIQNGVNVITLKRGENKIVYTTGDEITIKSSNGKSFRLTNIDVSSTTARPKSLQAAGNETLSTTLKLDEQYSINIKSLEVNVQPTNLPEIEILTESGKKYNINSKSGVPLSLKRSSNVTTIKLFIGEKTFTFTDFTSDTAVIIIPHSAFGTIGKYKAILLPSDANGDGDVKEIDISVVDESYVGVPDIRNIQYPSVLKGPDYVGTNVDFEITWDSVNTDYVRIFNGEGESYTQVNKTGKVILNVQQLLNLGNQTIRETEKIISFSLRLIPYNASGSEIVEGKTERINITFEKGDLVVPRNLVINRFVEAFTSQFSDSIFEDETSKYLTHLLHLGDGNNKVITTWTGSLDTLIVKLYEPLPTSIQPNQQVWISKLQSNPIIETITISGEETHYCPPLKGPNFNLASDNGIGYKVFDDLIASGSATSNDLILKYSESNNIDTTKLNISYVSGSEFSFENFSHFGSAEERIKNFFYKVQLIENYESKYNEVTSGSSWVLSTNVLKESERLLEKINGVKRTFDGFENFLYSDTSSSLSYPKSSGNLLPTTNATVVSWYDSSVSEASTYDKYNVNYLVNNLPEHIREDFENEDFILFLDMVGQHFDVIWSYINGINKTKLVEDKKLNGIANNMVYHLLASLGWEGKRAFDSQFLWEYAFGKYKDGTKKYDRPLEDANNEVWRRILNNLPYLLKHKGTGRAMKAIMACYGVPQSMLTIMEFGGPQDPSKNGTTKFTFDDRTAAIQMKSGSYVAVPWKFMDGTLNYPKAIEFRIKPDVVETATILEMGDISLSINQQTGSFVTLKLNLGSGITQPYFDSGVVNPVTGSPFYYSYTSSLSPVVISTGYYTGQNGDYVSPPEAISQSIQFPLSTENYSNILVNRNPYGDSGSLYEVLLATTDGTRITTYVSMSVYNTKSPWDTGNLLKVGNEFSGALDEFRLWRVPLQPSKFQNHTLHPDSIAGNSYTASTADLLFRLDFEYPKDRTITTNYGIKNVAINETYGETNASASNFFSASVYPYQYIPYDRTVTATVPSLGLNYSNKIRFEDQELITDLSYKVRASKKSFDQSPIDSNRLGLFFSPIKELNMDIVKAFGDFNIDNYIGDPADEYKDRYKQLEELREYYFERLDRNIYEYIQLIRYIDKSLFDVLADLAPARAKISKGLLIEPHYLERSKVRWDKPTSVRGDYDGIIGVSDNNDIESSYEVKNAIISAADDTKLNAQLPNYNAEIDNEDLYNLEGTNPNYDGLINYDTTEALDATAPFYNVDIECPTGEKLTGEIDSFQFQQIGMEKDSLANLGFGLYAASGNGLVRKWDGIFGNQETTGSRQSIFLVKEQYKQKISTQVSGYPVNGAQLGDQVVYEDVQVTKYKYKVSTLPFSGSVTVGNDVVSVTSLNGYFPTHYRYTNNLGEGMIRSFWKGSTQNATTTPDGLDPVETFTTNPNILRVAKTGRGSGEPILEVD